MKSLFRKSLSVILALSMLLSSIPFAALAEDIVEPTAKPTVEATVEPTVEPTVEATEEPTAEPAVEATVEPTAEPTIEATAEPTVEPTAEPTIEPTKEPMVAMFAMPRMLSAASADEQLNIARKGTLVEGNTITVVWNEMTGVDHYEITVKDETPGSAGYLYERKSVGTNRSFALDGLLANHTYKVWVGALCPGFDPMGIPGTHQDTMTFTIETAEEEEYDELVVSIEDPGEVTVGDSLIVRSNVSGGSGEYSYYWEWTSPDGIKLTDPNKNVRLFGTEKGKYTFILTVTDEITGEKCTTKKKTIEVGSDEEEYDPMKLTLTGPADEVELAEGGIGAVCSVKGGSGNFEYGWTIYLDGVKYKEYSYGMVEETWTLGLEKTGSYTISVTVRDLETGLTETASCSTKVVQKEYDPLTVEITSVPKYADINKTVAIKAVSAGGYGDVVTSYEVFLGNTCVAQGSGLVFSFVPSSEGKYKVVVRAEDDAQWVQDTAEILVGKLVKCSVSVSNTEVNVGDSITATIAVTDGIGPFSYDWMLYLDDTFVSSDLNSEKTSFTWTAEKAGTYRIDGSVFDEGKEELIGDLSFDSDSKNVVSKEVIVTPELTADKTKVMVGDSVTFTATNIDAYTEVYLYAEEYKLATLTAAQNSHTETFSQAGERTIILKDAEGNVLCSVKVTVELLGVLSNPVLTAASSQKMEDGLRVSWTRVDHADQYILKVKCPDGTTNTYEYTGNITEAVVTDLTQAGTYGVWMMATGYGYSQSQSDSVTVVMEETAPVVKPADPVVKVSVEGTTMLASWEVVEGAASYVYSVRDLDADKLVREYADGNSRTITLELEAGKKYRLAVAAVPAGVDPRTEATLCGWCEVEFETTTEEKPVKPADPVVTANVKGALMLANWEAVEGAASYVYSVRDLDADKLVREYADGNSRMITLELEAGKKYRLAVAAVPAGVDPKTEATLCGWCQVEFETTTEEKPVKPADPVVTVNVEGALMLANWNAVEGAASYVYSVRDLDADKLVREYADGNSRTITLELEAGKKYRLAVAAVPAGVDPRTEATLCGWCQVEFETAAVVKLPKPAVKVTVDGLDMVATWPAVEGADRYVFSLRDTNKSEAEYKHVETKGCSISLTLEAGVEYKLAVAAVPAEVKDTVAETTKCSWTEVVFKTETAEEMATPKVLTVESNASGVLMPGTTVTVKVICNKLTSKLNISGIANGQVGKHYFDENGRSCFDYSVVVSANGKYQLVFQTVDPNGKYSNDDAHKGILNITVCDHTTTKSPTKKIIENNPDSDTTHNSVQLYDEACVCGKIKNSNVRGEVVAVNCKFTVSNGSDPKHVSGKGKGHEYLNKCSAAECKNTQGTGKYASYRDNCASCEKQYGKDAVAKDSKKNSKSKVTEVQQYLVALDYDISYINKNGQKVEVDGQFGDKTEKAIKDFQIKHGLDDTGVVDDATWNALKIASEFEIIPGENGLCPKHGNFLAFGDECCACTGVHVYGDDPAYCLSCRVTFDVCPHNRTTYSEHPHYYKYCEDCKMQFDDQFRGDGRELSYCPECFPKNEIIDEHVVQMAELSQYAYETKIIVDKVINQGGNIEGLTVKKTGNKGIYTISGLIDFGTDQDEVGNPIARAVNGIRIMDESDFPDSYIEVSNTADGELIITVSFEGTNGLGDLIVDANTHTNEEGVHTGFANIAKDYIDGIFNGEFYIDAMVNGVYKSYRLSDLLGEVQDNDKAHIRVTGHSLGGAAAQCLAYYLVDGYLYDIPKEQIEVYTYASPIPFTYEALEDEKFREMNVYNFINKEDIVPDIGVSISDGIITRITEEGGAIVANKFKEEGVNGGASIAGTNMGTNIYISSEKYAGIDVLNHDMGKIYLPLVKDYVDGEIPSYVFNTDVFYSEHYDINTHKALDSIVDVGEGIVSVLE